MHFRNRRTREKHGGEQPKPKLHRREIFLGSARNDGNACGGVLVDFNRQFPVTAFGEDIPNREHDEALERAVQRLRRGMA